MADVRRGRLRPPSDAPAAGERTDHLVDGHRVTIEQILSGQVDTPLDYQPERHEWVAVLTGGATLDVDGETVDLAPGDWVVLPADVPHRLTRVDEGTSWLAVHFDENARDF
jgi:cupin 2 domain-containing protein